ncbi:MAG: hypothetical protein ABEI58_00355 [Candidatus Nanohaloarchaea archaeon]
MNKTLALIIAAMVFVLTAVTVVTMTTPVLGDINTFSEDQPDRQSCEFQANQVEKGFADSVSPRCQDYQRQQENHEIGQDLCTSGVIC